MEAEDMIEVRNLILPYGCVREASFTLAPGECVLLAGPNGCGKTTLLKALAPLGTLIPSGIPKVPGFTTEEFIRTACYRESDWAGRLSAGFEARLSEALGILGLTEFRHRDISSLSDGEFQKASIAAGLCRCSALLLLDEPTAFLDVDNRILVLRALREVCQKTGCTILFSSHDIHDSLEVCDRVITFAFDGTLFESGKTNRKEAILRAFPSINI